MLEWPSLALCFPPLRDTLLRGLAEKLVSYGNYRSIRCRPSQGPSLSRLALPRKVIPYLVVLELLFYIQVQRAGGFAT